MSVALVESGAALESMRNSDFDVYSAYGEVIDNSIQADGTEIRVLIDYKPALARGQREPIQFVAFGDNGDGMPNDILHRCLQLGYSTRYNDRSGIGRFGVGATLAAINQCQKVEIYSKSKGSREWNYTFVDLQLVTNKKQSSIPEPKPKAIPAQLTNLVPGPTGTLVIWSKYDRQPDDASDILKEFKVWAGRTYRKKIWDGTKIWVNNEIVYAVDPLYVTTRLTRFPDDPKAFEYEQMKLDWPIPSEDRLGQQSRSTILIRISLLPKEFRPAQGAGNTKLAKDRYIDQNEGISILRNDREVFFGHIPYWPGDPFKEIDRWWGCEISFHAELDRAFTVKNIKRGALPTKLLKEAIADQIEPTRRTALDSVRELWIKTKAEERTSADPGLDTGHSDAEIAAKDTPTPNSVLDRGKNTATEAKKFTDRWLKDTSEQQKAAWTAKFQSQPFTIVDDEWRGPEFFETVFLGGKSVLKYNIRHIFFAEIEKIRERLAVADSKNPEARRLKALVDLLLIAYAKSEAMFDPAIQLSAERFIEQLRMSWGNYLSSYIETFKNEVVSDT
jgi:hypothetical protein